MHDATPAMRPAPNLRPTDGAWTTRRLLDWMTGAFREKGLDSPRLLAELLLAHVIGCERLALYTQADRPASNDERERLRALVGRALKHEPVQYLVGEGWFFSLPFAVDSRVLIPRPATETIVEHVLQRVRRDCASLGCGPDGEGLAFLDLCAGSGCVAIAVLKNLSMARGFASDVSRDALDVARANAERHRVLERLTLMESDLLGSLPHECANLQFVVSNPPYIPDDEWGAVETNVKGFEPSLALRGGRDGLDLVRPILEQAPSRLRPGGELLVEVAASRAAQAADLACANSQLADVRVLRDFEGHDRVIVATRR